MGAVESSRAAAAGKREIGEQLAFPLDHRRGSTKQQSSFTWRQAARPQARVI